MMAGIEKYQKYGFLMAVGLGLLALSVVPFYVNADFHDTQRLISALLMAMALSFTVGRIQVSTTAIWLLSAAYLWAVVAVAWSPAPLWSLLEFSLLFSVVLVGICLMPSSGRMGWLDVDVTSLTVILTMIFAVIHAFYITHNLTDYTMTMVTSSAFNPHTLSNGFSNVRFYGQFLVWTMPFLIASLAVQVGANSKYFPKLPYRKLVLLLLMFDWAFELLAFTRAFLVAMAVTVPLAWWFDKQAARAYSKWFFISALGGCTLYVLMMFVIPLWLGFDMQAAFKYSAGRDILNSSGRTQLWLDALHQVAIHPWLGAGPMMTALSSVTRSSAHPHNFVVQLLAEWGIPFTALLLGGGVLGFLRWKKIVTANVHERGRERVQERVRLALPVTVSLVAGAAAGLFDGLIVMPVSLTYMALMLAILGFLWRHWTPQVSRRSFPRWLLPILLAPSLFVAYFVIANWSYSTIAPNAPAIAAPAYSNGYYLIIDGGATPRFWINGKISNAERPSRVEIQSKP